MKIDAYVAGDRQQSPASIDRVDRIASGIAFSSVARELIGEATG
jgi:hypothetical protein